MGLFWKAAKFARHIFVSWASFGSAHLLPAPHSWLEDWNIQPWEGKTTPMSTEDRTFPTKLLAIKLLTNLTFC